MFTLHFPSTSSLGLEGMGSSRHAQGAALPAKFRPDEKLPKLPQPTLPPRGNNTVSHAIWKSLLGTPYSHVVSEIRRLSELDKGELEARLASLGSEVADLSVSHAELGRQLELAERSLELCRLLPEDDDDAVDEINVHRAARAAEASKIAELKLGALTIRRVLLRHMDAYELEHRCRELHRAVEAIGTPNPQDEEKKQQILLLKSELRHTENALLAALGYAQGCRI